MSLNQPITWILESDVFPHGDVLAEAARAARQAILIWKDEWWANEGWPRLRGPAVFHGSLGNADRIRRELPWKPGAFCNTPAFACSAWYESARRYLLHANWEIMPATEAVAQGDDLIDRIGGGSAVFVRPDSPLKPFSGRVVKRGKLSLRALDHGFYYDDEELPVVVAAVQQVMREWRFVVCDRRIAAGSAYLAADRTPVGEYELNEPREFAAMVVNELPPPELIYVMDVCETPEGLRLLELNPFSGADLYECNGASVLDAVVSTLQDN